MRGHVPHAPAVVAQLAPGGRAGAAPLAFIIPTSTPRACCALPNPRTMRLGLLPGQALHLRLQLPYMQPQRLQHRRHCITPCHILLHRVTGAAAQGQAQVQRPHCVQNVLQAQGARVSLQGWQEDAAH